MKNYVSKHTFTQNHQVTNGQRKKEKEYKIRTLTVIFEYFDDDDEDEVNNEMDICVLSPRNCWLPVGTDHSAHHFFTLMTMMTILIILIMMMTMTAMMVTKW